MSRTSTRTVDLVFVIHNTRGVVRLHQADNTRETVRGIATTNHVVAVECARCGEVDPDYCADLASVIG
jgi:hypothetical protein